MAAKGPGGVGGMGEPVPVAREPEEIEGPEEVRESRGEGRAKEPTSIAGGPEEAGGLEEGRGPKEAEVTAERLEEVGGLEEVEPATRKPEELGGLVEPAAASLSSWSNCWQAFALATVLFCCCFSFFNRLVFS